MENDLKRSDYVRNFIKKLGELSKMKLNHVILYSTILFTILTSAGCITATKNAMPGGVDFNSLNVQDAKVVKTFETAKANNKNVLLIFDAVWCGYCQKFNQKTMKDAEVQKTLANFEVINVDVDKYPKVLQAFTNGKSEGVPLIMLFSPEGVQTDEIGGIHQRQTI